MYNFSNFTEDLENIVHSADSYKNLINASSESMRKLLANNDLIDNNFISQLLEGSTDCTVYKSNSNGFVVQVFVWEGGAQTPIHDHDTWGIMGIYRNQLKVTEYALKPLEQPGTFYLDQTQTFIADPGAVCYLIPPDEEIHQIINPTETLSVSIHVYGKTIDEYNIYDPENDKIIHRVV
jgi:predicted metal-dependent enzyme (double-stranded beta helix superfamily)